MSGTLVLQGTRNSEPCIVVSRCEIYSNLIIQTLTWEGIEFAIFSFTGIVHLFLEILCHCRFYVMK